MWYISHKMMNWHLDFFEDFLRIPTGMCRVTHHDFEKLVWFSSCAPKDLQSELERRLKALPYEDFLRTRYWLMVKAEVIHRQGAYCRLCRKGHRVVEVHHRTYEHHGSEHLHLDDFRVYCSDCHRKISEWNPLTEFFPEG